MEESVVESSTPETGQPDGDQPAIVESPYVRVVTAIYKNLEAAQAKTGAFTMVDCKNVRNAYTYLIEYFKLMDVNTTADDITYGAFGMLFKATELQQTKGVFTMDGSVELLSKLEFIHAKLDEIKDPSIKMREAKEALKKKNGRGKKQSE